MVDDDEFVLLFAGKIETKKNPHFLLKLSKALSSKSFKFLLVGNGHLEKDLKNITKKDS